MIADLTVFLAIKFAILKCNVVMFRNHIGEGSPCFCPQLSDDNCLYAGFQPGPPLLTTDQAGDGVTAEMQMYTSDDQCRRVWQQSGYYLRLVNFFWEFYGIPFMASSPLVISSILVAQR